MFFLVSTRGSIDLTIAGRVKELGTAKSEVFVHLTAQLSLQELCTQDQLMLPKPAGLVMSKL